MCLRCRPANGGRKISWWGREEKDYPAAMYLKSNRAGEICSPLSHPYMPFRIRRFLRYYESILPSVICTISSASFAKYLLCVTTITHLPSSCAVRFNNSIIPAAVGSSRFPVGSSANKTFALLASALAIATRCCCPPDSFMKQFLRLIRPSQFYIFLRSKIINQIIFLKN